MIQQGKYILNKTKWSYNYIIYLNKIRKENSMFIVGKLVNKIMNKNIKEII